MLQWAKIFDQTLSLRSTYIDGAHNDIALALEQSDGDEIARFQAKLTFLRVRNKEPETKHPEYVVYECELANQISPHE